MAEIISRNEITSRRIHSLKVDLTPMVNPGFLLVSFFVFTTTISETKARKLVMPKDDGMGMAVAASAAVTILPGEDKPWFYEGNYPDDRGKIKEIRYADINQLRNSLLQIKKNW